MPETSIMSETTNSSQDVYDKFTQIYFSVNMKIRNILLKRILAYNPHPVYTHLLKTMDESNSHYVMGYLQSQRSAELYDILNIIINSPLPTKYDFMHTTKYQ